MKPAKKYEVCAFRVEGNDCQNKAKKRCGTCHILYCKSHITHRGDEYVCHSCAKKQATEGQ